MQAETPLQSDAVGPGEVRPAERFFDRARKARPLRLALLLGLLVVLNAFDLGFTLLADHHNRLIELNPLAATVVEQRNWVHLAGYKLLLVTAGVGILWRLRHRAEAECAAWLMALTYVGVAWRWHGFLWLVSGWEPNLFLLS